jgi:hypothetical protein
MAAFSDKASDGSKPDRRTLADLSALADGTLASERCAEVRARISASPELSALYERERGVVGRLRAASADVRAPQALRTRIERGRPSKQARARRSLTYGASLAGAMAAVVLALVLLLPGGSPGAPSVSLAAALGSRAASAPAPVADTLNPTVKLSRDIEDVYFPNWSGSFGWRATGQREDTIRGRRAITVYYEWHDKRLAYTIVAAPALSQPRARVATQNGTVLRTFTLHGRLVVTWRRTSHTCVLSGSGIDAGTLQRLASWKAPGLERT